MNPPQMVARFLTYAMAYVICYCLGILLFALQSILMRTSFPWDRALPYCLLPSVAMSMLYLWSQRIKISSHRVGFAIVGLICGLVYAVPYALPMEIQLAYRPMYINYPALYLCWGTLSVALTSIIPKDKIYAAFQPKKKRNHAR